MHKVTQAKKRAEEIHREEATQDVIALQNKKNEQQELLEKLNQIHSALVSAVKIQLEAKPELEENCCYRFSTTPSNCDSSYVNNYENELNGEALSERDVYFATYKRFRGHWAKQFPNRDSYPESAKAMSEKGYMVLFALDCEQHLFSVSVFVLNIFAAETRDFDWTREFPLLKVNGWRNQRIVFATMAPRIRAQDRPLAYSFWSCFLKGKPASGIRLEASRHSRFNDNRRGFCHEITQTIRASTDGTYWSGRKFDSYGCSYNCPIY